ncbi:MAG: ABC transporter ATP-binding protein, partial [Maritimibacter sp.]
YAGGWSDYIAQRGEAQGEPVKAKPAGKKPAAAKPEKVKEAAPKSGLSFTEKHRLEALPAEIDRLSAEIAKLEELMADPELFTREPVKFRKATEALVERQTKRDAAEEEWLMLAEKAEG